ncbi:hypothetical protein, variant 2 [Capsaspora owczarzaki ATCC 30864]|uniref:Uncharacterized protein n=1 Tax=Capsaspora owczarzaki (strain ATCC 30864) TaxID=595528 RepID=A0A0D2WMB1_CAPO3|nr:hypothetical protein, variant 1 [Capsaspora owczarzaki ATCC 30864]KJE91258.1 hypothetical protein, variant 2 [Capsaspora owczarzaki ATCC 30864]
MASIAIAQTQQAQATTSAPSAAAAAAPAMQLEPTSVIVLDSGGGSIKAGWAHDSQPTIMGNCITRPRSARRTFVGNELDQWGDLSGLYYGYPTQKGFIVNWELQNKIWDHVLSSSVLEVNNFAETSLVLTEPLFNFPAIQSAMREVAFEEHGFQSLLHTTAPELSAYQQRVDSPSAQEAQVVVDSGFSSTYVVPFVQGQMLPSCATRIDVGGKVLTNYLKDVLSYRQINLMEETHVVNEMKEKACYVATDLQHELEKAKQRPSSNTISVDYVLPDYTTIMKGFVRAPVARTGPANMSSDEQLVKLNNERFSVPELLFHPSDVGIKQTGIPELIGLVVESLEEAAQYYAYQNVVLTGGNARFSGFQARM